jgi:hypothetical protein
LNLNLKATDDIEAFNLKLKRCGPIAGVTVGGHSPGPLQACHCGPWTRNLNFKLKLKVTVTQRPSSLLKIDAIFIIPETGLPHSCHNNEKSGLLHPRSSSSSIAAASTFCSPCSELPWTGKFFLPSISSHLRFLPYFPSSPFTPLLFPVLFPFSITPLCSPFVSSLSFIASPLSFYNE